MERSRARAWAGAIGAALGLVAPGVATAGSEPRNALFDRGSKNFGLSLGYGLGFRTGSKEDRREARELGDVSLIQLIPRFGIGLNDPVGGDAWYRGAFEALFEGALVFNTNPRFGWAIGGGTSLRYNFLAWRGAVPFVDANFGAVYSDFDLDGQNDGFNLNVGCGLGLHWFVSGRVALTPAIRYQHFSNAGTSSPNDGINDVLFLFGTTWFWK